MMTSPPAMYKSAMPGTMMLATLAMLLIPPNMTKAVMAVRMRPVIHPGTPKVLWMAWATELD